MNIIQTIKEEVQNFFESIADTAAERIFGIPNPEAEKDIKAKAGLQKGNEKPIAIVVGVPIYKNPKSLENFGWNTKAIGDKSGNLYVAQREGIFVHGQMGETIGLVNKGLDIYGGQFLLLNREKRTNTFNLSDTARHKYQLNKKYFNYIIGKIKAKNPQYDINTNIKNIEY